MGANPHTSFGSERIAMAVVPAGKLADGASLSFHATDRSMRPASATQVRRPIYTSAVGRWKAYEGYLGPLLKELRASGEFRENGICFSLIATD
jgi:hypothetical protein